MWRVESGDERQKNKTKTKDKDKYGERSVYALLFFLNVAYKPFEQWRNCMRIENMYCKTACIYVSILS